MPDDFEPRGHVFQDLRDILAQRAQRPATGRAVARCLVDKALARQALGQRTAHRLGFLDCRCTCTDGCQQFALAGFQLLEAQFKLGNRLIELLGGAAELHALQAREFDFELFDLYIA